MKMGYDVFISSKSQDYDYAEEVYDFLVQQGIKVFFAKRSLPDIGSTNYSREIDNALDETNNVIVVTSSEAYVNSGWVEYEWDSFANDLRNKRKYGNLLTILARDMCNDKLPRTLRARQTLRYEDYKKTVLSYLKDAKPHPPVSDLPSECYVCSTPPSTPEPDVPENCLSDLFGKLCTKAAAISPYDLLDKLGLDKSQLKRLLKENYGISLDNKDLMKCKTVEALDSLIKIAEQRNKKRNEPQNQH